MKLSRLSIALLLALPSIFSTGVLAAAIVATSSPGESGTPKQKEIRTVEIFSDAGLQTDEVTMVFAQAPDDPAHPLPLLPPLRSGQRTEHRELIRVPGGADIDRIVSNSLSAAFAGLPGAIGGRVVKNAPYSAEVINERIQTLPDGNQIVKRSSQMSYRDSAGRTRTEVRDANGGLRSINIFDSVEGTKFIVNPETKSATKIATDVNFQKHIEELREKAKAMAKDGKSTIVERNPGEEITIKRIEGPTGGNGQEIREEVNISVIRADKGDTPKVLKKSGANSAHTFFGANVPDAGFGAFQNMAELNHLGLLGTSFQDRAWSAKATTKELGTKDFDGTRAEGKLRSYTIPAGEIGNKNAILVTTETWTSPDLQITVYSKHSDPRGGDTVYRLANLKRTEQPIGLFNPPEGFTVKTMPAFTIKSK